MTNTFAFPTPSQAAVLALLAIVSVATADATTRPAFTCAVLTAGEPAGPAYAVATLAEARLGSGGVTLVDRQNAARVLDERRLQRLLAADAVGDRVASGRLLRADVLAVLRPRRDRIEAVVCDARRGLRLARLDLDPLTPEAAADAVAAAVRAAAGQADALRRDAVPVVAVPPFVSGDLLYEADYLRDAYARLAEAAVARAGGVAVELEEADALAAEAMLAGDGAPLRRALPVYLHGEFRNTRQDGKPRVSLTLRAVRGRDELWSVAETVPPADAATLIARAGERAAGASAPATRPDAAAELPQLAARAEVSVRLGEWAEAATLVEAALLLRPDDTALHRRAVLAYAGIIDAILVDGREPTMQHVRDNGRASFRGYDHVESYLARTTAERLEAEERPGGSDFLRDFFHAAQFSKTGHGTAEITAAFEADREKAVDRLLGMAERRVRGGNNDDYRFFIAAINLWKGDRYELAYRAVARATDAPHLARRIVDYGALRFHVDQLETPDGRRYLDRVEALPSPAAKPAVLEVRAFVRKTAPAAAETMQRATEELTAATRPVRPATDEASTYRPVVVRLDTGKGVGIHRLVAAGTNTDVILGGNAVYVSHAKGHATQVWQTNEGNIRPDALCYDGRYAWATLRRFGGPPILLRVDPAADAVVRVTDADGLPQPADDTLAKPKPTQRLNVAPLSPGRVMLAGYFGRSYLAVADTDAAGRTRVDVFHEAREQLIDADKEQWRRTTVAFESDAMATLTLDKGPHGGPMSRVFVGRGTYGGSYLSHPLVVDPDTKQVTVLEDDVYLRDDLRFAVRDGAMYFVWPTWRGGGGSTLKSATVWQVALPDLRKTKVCETVYPFQPRRSDYGHACAFLGDRFVVAGLRTYVAATPDGPYTPAGSTLPFSPTRGPDRPRFFQSSHYGLLMQLDRGVYEMKQFDAERP